MWAWLHTLSGAEVCKHEPAFVAPPTLTFSLHTSDLCSFNQDLVWISLILDHSDPRTDISQKLVMHLNIFWDSPDQHLLVFPEILTLPGPGVLELPWLVEHTWILTPPQTTISFTDENSDS